MYLHVTFKEFSKVDAAGPIGLLIVTIPATELPCQSHS
jgi:hypothetical protein